VRAIVLWGSTAAAVVAAIAGCGPEVDPIEPPAAAPLRALPGPGPQRREPGFDPLAENAACERCHQDIAAEWRSSMHKRAWDDGVFLAAYALEPLAFCRRCHAPEVDEARGPSDPGRHLGVGCVTCHVPGAAILGQGTLPPRDGAHAVVAATSAGATGWCASCHQFEFPEPQDAAMQSTVEEHAESLHRDRSCQDCHMPRAGGPASRHKSHAFQTLSDPAMLRAAVSAGAERSGDRSLTVTLRVEGAGHAVPTGDMFRRLEVRARAARGDDEQTAAPVVLSRVFRREQTSEGSRRRQIGDTRLPASGEPQAVTLHFPRPIEGTLISWEVAYRRMGPHEALLFGVDLSREEVILASGTVLPLPSSAPSP
jgi:hypothetical protein